MGYAIRYGKVVIPLREGRMLIGRAPSSLVRLDDPKVSRRHASVVLGDAGLFIEDLKSRTGVLVDGRRVQSRQKLHPGARIRVGDCELTVEVELEGGGGELDPQKHGVTTDTGMGFTVHREAIMRLLADGKLDNAREILTADIGAA